MLEKVIENWTSRLDYIRARRGSPMPEIIFKMNHEEGGQIHSPEEGILHLRHPQEDPQEFFFLLQIRK
ncbi:hypothetical protein TNCV_1860681 [Trichonephila clavipes]|nr:hypothetical protein TNCV_1860681 [Trichonephila clavipes]